MENPSGGPLQRRVHGNRELSRQNPSPEGESSFEQFIETLDEVVFSLRFEEDALITTFEIERREEKP